MKHLSLRLAWHENGWDGHICKNPKANIYCIGKYSYEAPMIRKDRNLEIEEKYKGKQIDEIEENYIPPCCFGINAFGLKETNCYKEPPDFFKDDTKIKTWIMPPASACIWPYEEMYQIKTTINGKQDAKKRINEMRKYFSIFEEGKTLIFYYVNYDNPFSIDDKRYVIAGISRLKKISDEIRWENQSEKSIQQYGEVVWGRIIESKYPDEGLRIPYEKYKDNEEVLSKILFIPENSRNFKYGTRQISDDDALELIERFVEIVSYLKEIGDKSENWDERLKWLSSIMGVLWKHRGVYPGLFAILDYLDSSIFIPKIRNFLNEGIKEEEIYNDICNILKNTKSKLFKNDKNVVSFMLDKWEDLGKEEQKLLIEVLPKFDLTKEQVSNILSEKRKANGIYSGLKEILDNPYILSEEYVGDDVDDYISFNKIDHGIFINPELGVFNIMQVNDTRRFRALIVDVLKKTGQHSFLIAKDILDKINKKLDYMPEWKKTIFNLNRLERKKIDMVSCLHFKEHDNTFIYLKYVYELEKNIDEVIRKMISRPDINITRPVTEVDWRNYIYKEDYKLNKDNPKLYEKIINHRINLCKKLFTKPISIISGEAGTGKTTIVKAIIKAIRKAYGEGSSFQLLAPTGKAAERLRKTTGESADTIHSFLAQRGWLNKNFTFTKNSITKEESKRTIIIDESSMIDLYLLGTLFRSINFDTVQRLIFVGDYNQLPPIGIGKPFVDIVEWIKKNYKDNVGVLFPNLRAIESKGMSLRLASIFTNKFTDIDDEVKENFRNWEEELQEEDILIKIQKGGTISNDLKVIFWNEADELMKLIKNEIIKLASEYDIKENVYESQLYRIFKINDKYNPYDPDKFQIISPFRSEEYGVEALNQMIQKEFNNHNFEKKGNLSGITYSDKIIQYRNRPKSNPYKERDVYNFATGKNEKLEIYNGETGFIYPHSFDIKKRILNIPGFRLHQFQAKFKGKENYRVSYDNKLTVDENLELAYAISVHKSQGSEFDHVFFVLPNKLSNLLSKELFYTGITRSQKHITLFIQNDIEPLFRLRRKENSSIIKINSSIMKFDPVPLEIMQASKYYEEGKIHRTLIDVMVRSKSEALIANMLYQEKIKFIYEKPLLGGDGLRYLPDFTIYYNGEEWYWEHLGLLGNRNYEKHWEKKKKWYKDNNFFQKLYTTEEKSGADSKKWLEGFFQKIGKIK